MLGHGRLVFGRRQEPPASGLGVGHRLLSGEGLGGHQEQHRFGVDPFQRLDQVGAVDVGDKVNAEARPAIRL